MKIKVNGEIQKINEKMTLKQLAINYQLDPEKIVIEYNGDIPQKEDYEKIFLNENDIVELIHFVGGG